MKSKGGTVVLALLVLAALTPLLPSLPAASAASEVSQTQSGVLKTDTLTSGDTSYWTAFGDILSQVPNVAVDHQVTVAVNSGTSVPAASLGTGQPNDIIVVFVSLTCGATASCAQAPAVASIGSSPSLTWTLRNSEVNGGVAAYEYYAVAASKGTWKVSVTATSACACVVMAFGVSGTNTSSPFDAGPASMAASAGTSGQPAATLSTSFPKDMVVGMIAQGAATAAGNLKVTAYGSGFKEVAQKATGNPGNPPEFNVQGAAEYEVTSTAGASGVSLTTGGSYPWAMLADSFAPKRLYSYYEDSQGLHIGVQASAAGKFGGFFAETPDTLGQLFHATVVLPYSAVPSGTFDTGIYVQTSSNNVNYIFCGASVGNTGYSWSVVETTGSSSSATKYTTLWSQAGGPLTRDCTIVTNGSNFLTVYVDGVAVYSSSSAGLTMPSPFNAYLEVESTYAGGMLTGTYRDYYSTTTDSVILSGAAPGDTAEVVGPSGAVVTSTAVDAGGTAVLPVGMFLFPITGSLQVYDGSGTLVDSTQSGLAFFGGDRYAVGNGSLSGPSPPMSPTGLNATGVSASQVSLQWTAPASDGGAPVSGYKVERSADGGTSWTAVDADTQSNATSFTDENLAPSTTYAYRVSAINEAGTSPPSNIASATTQAQPPPTTSTITVYSQLTSGGAATGIYVVLSQAGATVETGYTPASFTVTNGQRYSLTAENYGNYYFEQWADTGSGNATRTVDTNTSLTMTAVYCSGPCPAPTPPPGQSTLTVNTVTSSGQTITGYFISLWQNGVQVSSCYSPCSFTVNDGQTYQVAAASYGSETFSHWSNDGSTGFESVNVPGSSTTMDITAVYSP